MNFEDFLKGLDKLISYSCKAYNSFISSVDSVTRFVQSRYPEVVAEYTPSDGIIFVGLDGTRFSGFEFYSVADLQKFIGNRL